MLSKQIPDELKSDMFFKTSPDTNNLCDRLVAVKGINRASPVFTRTIRPCLMKVLTAVQNINHLHHGLARQTKEAYDEKNPEHEYLLLRLWNLLRPGVSLSARHSKDWGQLGFQARNPATDFRGMGVLGLQNMVTFAEKYPKAAKAIVSDCMEYKNWFPFAITGITLTRDILGLLRTGDPGVCTFFLVKGCTPSAYDQLYAHFFTQLNDMWTTEQPEDIMQFGRIHRMFIQDMKDTLCSSVAIL